MNDALNNVPASLVKSILMKTGYIVEQSKKITSDFENFKKDNRDALIKNGFLHQIPSDLSIYNGMISAIDGAMIVNPKSFGDITFAASVEAPYSKTRQDSEVGINHFDEVEIIPRHVENSSATGALMSLLEVHLASQTQSDLCMIDGSFFSTIVNVFKGAKSIHNLPGGLASNQLSKKINTYLGSDFNNAIYKILSENKYIAFPKYTTQADKNNSFGLKINKEKNIFDFKTILSRAMEEGEYTSYIKNEPLNNSQKEQMDNIFQFNNLKEEIFDCLDNIYSFYYKPHPLVDSIRVDTVGMIKGQEFKSLLEALTLSCQHPVLKEPYPIFLADNWAKSISQGATPLIEGAVINQIEDPELKYMFMSSYRTS